MLAGLFGLIRGVTLFQFVWYLWRLETTPERERNARGCPMVCLCPSLRVVTASNMRLRPSTLESEMRNVT